MIIRPWTKEDIPVIAEMEKACFHDAWTEEMLSDTLRYPIYNCFLAEEGGQVCGYASMMALFENAEIGNIAVDTPFRGQGISKLLMDKMHETAKSMGKTGKSLAR